MKIRVHYIVQDGGDGSYSVGFYKTAEEAKQAREKYEKYTGIYTDQNGTYYEDFELSEYEHISSRN